SISTRPKRQLLAGACPGTAAQSEADNGQRLIEPERATAIGRDHRRQALAEDAAVTILIRAEELARLQPQADGNACRGQIGQLSFIATVKPGRDNLASGAMTLSLGSLHHDSNQVCLRDNLFQFECDRISKERLHPLLYTSRSLGSPEARENQFLGATTYSWASQRFDRLAPVTFQYPSLFDYYLHAARRVFAGSYNH